MTCRSISAAARLFDEAYRAKKPISRVELQRLGKGMVSVAMEFAGGGSPLTLTEAFHTLGVLEPGEQILSSVENDVLLARDDGLPDRVEKGEVPGAAALVSDSEASRLAVVVRCDAPLDPAAISQVLNRETWFGCRARIESFAEGPVVLRIGAGVHTLCPVSPTPTAWIHVDDRFYCVYRSGTPQAHAVLRRFGAHGPKVEHLSIDVHRLLEAAAILPEAAYGFAVRTDLHFDIWSDGAIIVDQLASC
jgi:hypothetical protein